MSSDFLNFTKNGLQFLNRICSQQPNIDLDDELGTPVDEEEGDIDRESDVNLEENRDDIDVDLVEGSDTVQSPKQGLMGSFLGQASCMILQSSFLPAQQVPK